MKQLSKNQLLVTVLIVVGALTRILPHAPNFTAIAAVALFSGALVKNRSLAFLIPLTALFVSDLIINNLIYPQYFDGFSLGYAGMWAVYGSFLLVVLMGRLFMIPGKPGNMLMMSVTSAIVFFLITNFQVWSMGGMYPANAAGLAASYLAALPFLGNMVAGTGVYLFAMYYGYKLVSNKLATTAAYTK